MKGNFWTPWLPAPFPHLLSQARLTLPCLPSWSPTLAHAGASCRITFAGEIFRLPSLLPCKKCCPSALGPSPARLVLISRLFLAPSPLCTSFPSAQGLLVGRTEPKSRHRHRLDTQLRGSGSMRESDLINSVVVLLGILRLSGGTALSNVGL